MKKSVFYRSPHNYDLDQASDEAAIPAGEHGTSLTIQSQTEDADLNVLMKRYGVTGHLPQTLRLPQYGDFTHITDYRTALESIRDAQAEFLKLPPELRNRYNNDPQLFLEAVHEGTALPALRDAGLLGAVTAPPPSPSEGSPSSAAPAAS